MAGYKASGGMASRAVKTEHEGQHQDPQPEKVAGTVFPYRGVESHGVEPTQAPPEYLDDQWPEDSEVPHYEQGPTESDPLPVKVVNEHSVSLTTTRMRQIPVSGSTRVLARNTARVQVFLRNIGTTNAVYLTHEPVDDGYASINGYKIPAVANAGAEVGPIKTTDEMFATTGDGTTATLAVMEVIEIPI